MENGDWDNPNPRFCGVGKGARTLDTRNHNPVLCQLSYTHHINGTPRGIRTPGLLLRRQLLYPTELLAHIETPKSIEIQYPLSSGFAIITYG